MLINNLSSLHKFFQIKACRLAAAMFLLSVTSGCFFWGEPKPIYIGEFLTKTGPEETFGLNAQKGIELAVAEFNKVGGIDGRKIVIISTDPNGEKAKIESAVKKFARNREVLAVIGEMASERSNWAARVAQEARIPMISPSSTNPSVTEKGEYIFRACYIDPFQGYAMARFARDMAFKRVGVLRSDRSNYSIGLSEFFIDTFRQLGGTVVVEETYSNFEGTIDLKSQVAAIKRAKIEALFMPVYYADAVAISRELRRLGVKAQLLGGDGWDSPELLESGNSAIEGVFITNHFSAKSAEPEVRRFVSRYHSRFDTIPDGMAAMGYDAASIILASLRKIASNGEDLTRENLRRELSDLRDFEGITGLMTMDENRNPRKPIVILQARKGRFEYVKTIRPVAQTE